PCSCLCSEAIRQKHTVYGLYVAQRLSLISCIVLQSSPCVTKHLQNKHIFFNTRLICALVFVSNKDFQSKSLFTLQSNMNSNGAYFANNESQRHLFQDFALKKYH